MSEAGTPSGSIGWTCRNGHFNDGQLTQTVCIHGWNGGTRTTDFPCGAIREPRELYEDLAPDEQEIGSGRWLSDRAKDKSMAWRFNKSSGRFVCHRCESEFASKSTNVQQLEAKISGFSQPGSNFEFFSTREELNKHIRDIHGGKPYGDKHTRRLGRRP